MARRAVTPLGVLRNPSSSGNRGRAPRPAPPGVVVIEARSAAETPAALAALRAAGVVAVVVDGGDGTVRETATHLAQAFGGAPPPLGVLPHGNTNLIARSLGALADEAALAALAARLRAGRLPPTRRAAMLALTFDDGRAPLRGFMMGWGAYERATRLAADEIAARGAAQVRAAFLTALKRALIGAEARALRAGVAARLAIDDADPEQAQRFLGLVTALPGRLTAGFNPFWGAGAGPLRWLDVRAPARLLPLAAPLAAYGLPMGWMARAGYRSGRARRIALRLDGRFVLDGERYAGGAITVSADETLAIITS